MLKLELKTVLHGLCLIALLPWLGANLWLTDNSGLTALDHAVLDRPPHVEYSKQAPLEVLTPIWGIVLFAEVGRVFYSKKKVHVA